MGSKCRIAAKLRQNAEYPAVTKFLKSIGLRFTTHPATGSGHPFLMIVLPDGREIRHSIACTQKGGGNIGRAMTSLKRQLRSEGYDVG